MKTIKIKAKICKTNLQKSLGVMFKKQFTPHVFENVKYFHTYFCLPIEFVFLNKQNKVISAKKAQPHSIIFIPKNTIKTIEMMTGNIKKYDIKKGDKIKTHE